MEAESFGWNVSWTMRLLNPQSPELHYFFRDMFRDIPINPFGLVYVDHNYGDVFKCLPVAWALSSTSRVSRLRPSRTSLCFVVVRTPFYHRLPPVTDAEIVSFRRRRFPVKS